jgi:hypothetical protein
MGGNHWLFVAVPVLLTVVILGGLVVVAMAVTKKS